MRRFFLVLSVTIILFPPAAFAEIFADIEAGRVYTGYNDLRIPGDSGTKFSLKDDLSSDPEWFYRARLGYLYGGRHYFSALYAPLEVKASGTADREIRYRDTVFPAGTKLDATYKFNSYRLTYRYNFSIFENFTFGAGITGKVRDAAITIEGGGQREEKTDLGFVPLINFMAAWTFFYPLTLYVGGDALASKYGRAEDAAFALMYNINPHLTLYAGYRILEGGADNDEVYTFALFHYIMAGVTVVY